MKIVDGLASIIGVDRTAAKASLQFDRNVPYASTLVDNLTLALGGTPPGHYTLTLAVTDRVSGRATSRAATLVIRE
jgi:hypothetical protein